VKLSLIVGNWWFRLRYPDTGLWHKHTKTWTYNDRPQKRTEWFRVHWTRKAPRKPPQ